MRYTNIIVASLLLVCACSKIEQADSTLPKTQVNEVSTEGDKMQNFESMFGNAKMAKARGWTSIGAASVFSVDGIPLDDQNAEGQLAVDLVDEASKVYRVFKDTKVDAGSEVKVKFSAFAEKETDVMVSIIRHCGSSDVESGHKRITLDSTPKEYVIAKTFNASHECFRLQISNINSGQTRFIIYSIR